MQPRIVDREAFTVMGVIERFASAAESFGELWERFMEYHDQIQLLSTDQGYYGVYFGTDHARPLDYLAGMAVGDVEDIPEGAVVREVPAARYAVFECPLFPGGETYAYIFHEWLPESPYEQADQPGFDYYAPDTTAEGSSTFLHVPVRERGSE
jgi:AraC family transcriptional regulator